MKQITKAGAERVMRERGWLPLLPEAFRAEVLRRSIVLHFAPGEVVFHLGDPAGGIYGLVAGTVSVSLAPDGSTPRLILLGFPVTGPAKHAFSPESRGAASSGPSWKRRCSIFPSMPWTRWPLGIWRWCITSQRS